MLFTAAGNYNGDLRFSYFTVHTYVPYNVLLMSLLVEFA